jgi:ketosteroid isomerase-like protein
VWHNSDRAELGKDAALARIGAVAQVADGVSVEVIRFEETTFGFVEQLVLRGTIRATGRSLALHNCLVVTTLDGTVARIDEYVDPNVIVQMAGRDEERPSASRRSAARSVREGYDTVNRQ